MLSVINLYLFFPLDSRYVGDILGWFRPVFAAFAIVFPVTFCLRVAFPVAGLCYAKHVGNTGASVEGCTGPTRWEHPRVGVLPILVNSTDGLHEYRNLACVCERGLGLVLFVLEPGRTIVRNLRLVPVVLSLPW